MIFQDQGVPALFEIPHLRIEKTGLELLQIKRLPEKLLAGDVVRSQVAEEEDRIQFLILFLRILQGVFHGGMKGFTDREAVVFCQCPRMELLQEFMHSRSVHIVRGTLLKAVGMNVIADRIHLGKHVEHIKAEAVDSFVHPEAEDVRHLFSDSRVLPVEIGLFLTEEMEVEFIAVSDSLPCASGKGGFPVGRRKEFSLPAFPLADDVVIPVRAVRGFHRFAEPGMLDRGMIDHHIHDHLQIPFVAFLHQPLKVLHRAELLVDRPVVADVISVIIIGRFVQGRKPDRRNPEIPDVIQF